MCMYIFERGALIHCSCASTVRTYFVYFVVKYIVAEYKLGYWLHGYEVWSRY